MHFGTCERSHLTIEYKLNKFNGHDNVWSLPFFFIDNG